MGLLRLLLVLLTILLGSCLQGGTYDESDSGVGNGDRTSRDGSREKGEGREQSDRGDARDERDESRDLDGQGAEDGEGDRGAGDADAGEHADAWSCPVGDGRCRGNVWSHCDPESHELLVVECFASGDCAAAACDPVAGCVETALDRVPCSDGDACSVGDFCAAGVCEPGAALVCDDGNQCTGEACVPGVGCQPFPVEGEACDDGLECSVGDHCKEGECVPEVNGCECFADGDCASLDDGDPCNGVLVCDDWTCLPDLAAAPDCSSLPHGQCTAGGCDPETGGCKLVPLQDGLPCDDGDACTEPDTCAGGLCFPGSFVSCLDGNPCTADSCSSELGCQYVPVDGACSDGNACTGGDHCLDGGCAPGWIPDCDDGNACTEDGCEAQTGCWHEAKAGECSDGDKCTVGDSCVEGECVGSPVSCESPFACLEGVCTCPAACPGMECGVDPCGLSCGVCGDWEECDAGVCVEVYPPPPYGVLTGSVLENYAFLDEDAQTERRLGEFYQDGKLLIVQWSSGWCIVCKEDTWVFNQWQAEHGPNGLRILSLLYEDSAEQPMTAGFLAWWKQVFSVTYPLWIDPTTAGPDGKAAGGALSDFIAPKGPYSDGAFPVTLLVCPETMKILYEKQAFKYAEVQPLVDLYLYEVDCAK